MAVQSASIPPIKNLLHVFFDEDQCIEYLIANEILSRLDCCNVCNGKLSRTGKKLRCTRNSCRKAYSIFQNSIFSKNCLSCNEILHLGYLWLLKIPTNAMVMQTGHSNKTICEYRKQFRQLVTSMIDPDDVIIGGPGIIVQVDETKLGKRKYHRGHRVEGAWVIVGVEKTDERLVFAEVVPDRSGETILKVLERHIAERSIIHTDKWKGYAQLSTRFQIEHHDVNHSLWFKDPCTGVNTNTVEGTNYAIKRSIEPRNRTYDLLPSYLFEFIWRRKHKNKLWEGFINALGEVGYL